MQIKHVITAIGFSLFLAATATTQIASAAPQLTEEAAEALAGAETRIKQAKAQKSLWTSAEGALAQAQEAAKKGDSDAVLKFASRANEQAFLGMAQLNYPLTDN